MSNVIGIDIGTTAIKCVLFDEGLNPLEERYSEYPLITLSASEIEQDAEQWWAIICGMLRQLCAAGAGPVAAVSISSQGITTVPVDEDLRPLHNAICWLDHRPGTGGEALVAALGPQRYFDITARPSPAQYSVPRIAWLARATGGRAAAYLMPLDFITARLCGRRATDHSMAAGTGAYDIRKRTYSEEVLAAAGIDQSLLPEICESGSLAGRVTAVAAAETGLPEGAAVAIGAQDQKCGALGARLAPGCATLSMGTAFALTVKTDGLSLSREGFIPVFSDIFGDGYQMEACINTGGAAMKWWKDSFCAEGGYKGMDAAVAAYVPGADTPFCLPHFSGHGHPCPAPGARAGFVGLSLSTTPAAMAYALMEGLAFELRRNLEAIGGGTARVRAFGGGANADVLLQLMADACGIPFEAAAIGEAGCLGAAMLAQLAAGLADRPALAARGCPVRRSFTPDPAKKALLDGRYAAYLKADGALMGG